jgi:predicted nucleic acid-binding protein
MSSFGAILDACVLFSAPIRDTLLRIAAEGLYTAYWTEDILDELRKNLVSSGRISEKQAKHLIDTLKSVFPEAIVRNHRDLIGSMRNDPKDRHVLAAAVASASQVIVTDNLRDFPSAVLDPYNIEAQSADEFLSNLFDLAPDDVTRIVLEQAADLRKPPVAAGELLTILERQAPTFAGLVRQYTQSA